MLTGRTQDRGAHPGLPWSIGRYIITVLSSSIISSLHFVFWTLRLYLEETDKSWYSGVSGRER